MDFEALMKERRSVRNYLDKPVEENKLAKILEAGRRAPTGVNSQPQKIYVLKSAAAMQKARNFTKMMYNAPMAMLVCYDDTASWKGTPLGEPEYDGGEVDTAIVTACMMLQAADLGVDTLWVRGFNVAAAAKVFDLPDNIHPVCFLLLGYSADSPEAAAKRTSRKPLSETVAEL